MKTVFIYTLIDPSNNEIRYVGKTNSIKKRLYCHVSRARNGKSKSHKNNWIKSLLSKNLKPNIKILEEVAIEFWEESEIYWIEQLRQWGFRLTNVCEGGKGAKTGKRKPLSKQHKKSISDSVKKRFENEPNYNRGEGNTKKIINRDEIYQKYIKDNLSLNKCADYFGVGKKKIFETIKEYNIKKDKSIWKKQLQSKKIVLQYDLNCNFIKKWEGLQIINDELGFNKSNIANCCRGLCKTASGYIWRYEDNFIELVKVKKQKYKINITQYDLNNNLLNEYSSINKASKSTGVSRKIIKRCCEKENSYDNFFFKYNEI